MLLQLDIGSEFQCPANGTRVPSASKCGGDPFREDTNRDQCMPPLFVLNLGSFILFIFFVW